jgi:hypothetical protein
VAEVDARYYVSYSAASTTTITVYLYDLTAGAAEAVAKTINYYAEYKP